MIRKGVHIPESRVDTDPSLSGLPNTAAPLFKLYIFIVLLIYLNPRSLWFALVVTLREGRNGGQHVPGRRYVNVDYFFMK